MIPAPSLALIIRVAADAAGITPRDICSARRDPRLVMARHAAMWLARRLTPHSYPVIGGAFGGRDHSTVMYGVAQTEQRIRRDACLALRVMALKAAIEAAEPYRSALTAALLIWPGSTGGPALCRGGLMELRDLLRDRWLSVLEMRSRWAAAPLAPPFDRLEQAGDAGGAWLEAMEAWEAKGHRGAKPAEFEVYVAAYNRPAHRRAGRRKGPDRCVSRAAARSEAAGP